MSCRRALALLRWRIWSWFLEVVFSSTLHLFHYLYQIKYISPENSFEGEYIEHQRVAFLRKSEIMKELHGDFEGDFLLSKSREWRQEKDTQFHFSEFLALFKFYGSFSPKFRLENVFSLYNFQIACLHIFESLSPSRCRSWLQLYPFFLFFG